MTYRLDSRDGKASIKAMISTFAPIGKSENKTSICPLFPTTAFCLIALEPLAKLAFSSLDLEIRFFSKSGGLDLEIRFFSKNRIS
jgi:hypothetical protein